MAPGVSPRGTTGSPNIVSGHSSEGSAFAAALATYGNAVQGPCWIQNSTQDVIYEKLPADIAERHVLLMDPVLSTGNSAYTAIEVGLLQLPRPSCHAVLCCDVYVCNTLQP